MRTGVTLDDITRAADQLLAAGERPTVESVRSLLGTGAPATVNRLLKEYYQALGGRLTLPPAIAQASASLYSTIQQTAQADADTREAELQTQLQRERDRLAADRAAFEQERQGLRDRAVAQATEIQQLQEFHASLERRLAESEQDRGEQRRRAAAAEAQASAALAERQRAEEKHQEELQHQRSRAEGNEKHFLQQIDELRTQLRRVQSDREKETNAGRQRLSELENRLNTATANSAQMRNELTQTQEQLAREREKSARLEMALADDRQRFDRELTQLRGQNEMLTAENLRERNRSEEFREARDRALQEAALYQGRAQAFQAQVEQLQNPKPKAGLATNDGKKLTAAPKRA